MVSSTDTMVSSHTFVVLISEPPPAEVFRQVVCVDSSTDVVEQFRLKVAERKIDNVVAKQFDAKDLHHLGDADFTVIVVRNSLHFIEDIPKFYDDLKFVLKSCGVFLKISSPLFDLNFPEDSFKSSLIDSELKTFLETKFRTELEEYWQDHVKSNFVRHCDPFRKVKHKFLGELEVYEVKTSKVIHLLELKTQIKELSVVNNFIAKHSIEEFESVFENFLRNICFLLNIDACDMYFENILLVRKDTYHIEAHTNKE